MGVNVNLEALRLADERLAAGTGTQLDVLNAQQQLDHRSIQSGLCKVLLHIGRGVVPAVDRDRDKIQRYF